MKPSFLVVRCLLLCLSSLALLIDAASAAETGHISGDIFGKKSRWYHASLSLYEAYNDNIFNSADDTESDLITGVSPGIQFMVPGSDQPAEAIDTDTTTPGGLVFGRFAEESFRRFRAYLGYAPWFQFYADNTDQNVVNHYAQTGAQLNLRGGLTLDLVNRFVKDYDRSQANQSTQTDQYYSNVFSLLLNYPLSPKFRIRADYTNNFVDYTDDANDFRNRTDNAGSGYIFYDLGAKTAVFLQYSYTNIDYREDDERDGDQQDYLAGFVWDITAKTSGSFRAGYGTRHYDQSSFDPSDRFVFAGNLRYRFSPKTEFAMRARHRNEESSELAYAYTVTTGGGLTWTHHLRHNLDFVLDLDYEREEYRDGDPQLVGSAERTDDYFNLSPSLAYTFRRWLTASLAYAYRDRDSDVEDDSFTGNLVVFKLTGSI